MAKKRVKRSVKKAVKKMPRSGISKGLAIGCLILNIIIPGVGSLIGGRVREGVSQLVLLIAGWIVGILLFVVSPVIGGLLLFCLPLAAWIWGIVTGVNLIKKSH